ncbi:hypothetical protein LIER_11022 [Lithospermum erythrorhizon]|uniref:Uncharacterized protein n=1 Tax=Lithospermum erythrorhizon TaxID=34254 RepID=A0AAV3PRL4_LITER
MAEENDKKRSRTCSLENEEVDTPEVKKLRQDLFDNLEDDEICSTNEDLDSFMKSFEEQILFSHAPPLTDSAVEGDVLLAKSYTMEPNLIPLDNVSLRKSNQIESNLVPLDEVGNVSLPKLIQTEPKVIPLDGIDNVSLPKPNQIKSSLILLNEMNNVSLTKPNQIEPSLIPLDEFGNVSLSKPNKTKQSLIPLDEVGNVLLSKSNQIELSIIQLDEVENENMSLLDLGYLLEASDDELGLPPPSTASPPQLADEEVEELVPVTGFDSFQVDFLDFDSFEFGLDLIENNSNGVGDEYLELDGLFDYSDMCFGSADFVC